MLAWFPLEAKGCRPFFLKGKDMDTIGLSRKTRIKTASGYFDLASPSPGDIRIDDIASALSRTTRFGGHCDFYSVAEHSVIASCLSDTHPLEVLMHDAAEAYVGDVVKPLKLMLGEAWERIESSVHAAIVERFNLRNDEATVAEIHRCDRLALKAEMANFWPKEHLQWDGMLDLPLHTVQLRFYCPGDARLKFLQRAFYYGVDS